MNDNEFLSCEFIELKGVACALCTLIGEHCGMVRWCKDEGCLKHTENYYKYGCALKK